MQHEKTCVSGQHVAFLMLTRRIDSQHGAPDKEMARSQRAVVAMPAWQLSVTTDARSSEAARAGGR